jgi:anti-anti-sigma factor
MFEINKIADLTILKFFGDIAHLEMELVESLFASLRKHDTSKILLDLSEVEHMHYRVMQRILSEAKRLQADDGLVRVVTKPGGVQQTLQFIGADQSIEDYANLGEAILSFVGRSMPARKDRVLVPCDEVGQNNSVMH